MAFFTVIHPAANIWNKSGKGGFKNVNTCLIVLCVYAFLRELNAQISSTES